MASLRVKSLSLEAQAISKIKEHFENINGTALILDLRENCLIEECVGERIVSIEDKVKRNRYSHSNCIM